MKRASTVEARCWRAISRLEARGERPTGEAVILELKSIYGVGASKREVSPVVESWRRDVIARARERIEAAVEAVVMLQNDIECEEVMRLFRQRYGGGIRLSVRPERRPDSVSA